MPGKKPNPQQARDRRAKIMLAVLGLVFVGVLALELPKIMGGGGGGSPAAAPAATTPTATATATPTVAAPAPALASAPSQLTHFSRFAAKDPFKAQAGTATTSGGGSTAPAATTTPAVPKPKPKPAVPPIQLTMTEKPVVAPAGPRIPAALLLIDGKKQIVALNAEFPVKHPVFKVIALSQDAIWIELVGGSLTNGQQTIKLARGRKVTLADTTAGLKLALALVKPTTAPVPVATPAATAAATAG
jgi:hypothetical protein